MNSKEKVALIKCDKTKYKKRKIITNVILSLIVFVGLTFTESTIHYMTNIYSYQSSFRELVVGSYNKENKVEDNVEKIKEIAHIEDLYEQREKSQIVDTIKLANKDFKGDINLVGKATDQLVELSNNNYKDKYSIICPQKLINNVDIEVNNFTSRKMITNMDKYINEDMVIQLTSNKDSSKKDIALNIVGTFKNTKGSLDYAECYVSHELIKDFYDYYMEGFNDGSLDYKVYYIEIDDVKNLDEVQKNLNNIGFNVGQTSMLNYDFLNFLHALRYYIIFIIIVFASVFIYKFTISSVEEKTKQYAIYKSIGMDDEDYESLINIENTYVLVKSFIYSISIIAIILLLIYLLLYFYPLMFYRIIIKPNFLSLIGYFIISSVLIFITSKIALKRIKKKSVETNLSWWINDKTCIKIFYKW